MPIYNAPLKEMKFILDDVFHAESFWQTLPHLQHVDISTAEAILEEMAKFSQGVIQPLNRTGDEEGAKFVDGGVVTPNGFKEAFRLYAEGGWIGLGAPEEWGGQGMPKMLTALVDEMVFSANPSFTLYPLLSVGACMALAEHASEEIKQTYLPRIYSGEWAGTMCLTEPQCGTDLGIIRTKAIPNNDGSYAISGTKIFITGGDQDLTSNLVHLVLAKLPDAPEGTRGISLFLVPKFLVNADGSLGERNNAGPGSIEHKMGIKASATCVMNFDGAKGYLIGKVNQGLAAMFVMMNYERLSMGLQGIGASEVAYQNAAQYAIDRLQGRNATGAVYPDKPADPIIVHPDVRRMLLNARAQNEAGRCFAVYVAKQLDTAKYGDVLQKVAAAERVALLTPVAKAFLTDMAFDACVDAQMVFGGHGYIREWGMEQFIRDVRIAQIYEGTNGVQSQDLLGRKVVKNDGVFVKDFLKEIREFAAKMQAKDHEVNKALLQAADTIEKLTASLILRSQTSPNLVNAVCVDYLKAFGLLCYTYMFAMMVEGAHGKLGEFYQSKPKLAQYFVERIYPEIDSLVTKINSQPDVIMDFPADYFVS